MEHQSLPTRPQIPSQPPTNTLVPSSGQKFVLASWERAVEKFNSDLRNDKEKKLKQFNLEGATFPDLKEAALSAAKQHEKSRKPWASKVKKLVNIIIQNGQTEDSLISLAPYSQYTTLAFGAVRYLLTFVAEESNTAEALTEGLETIVPIILRAEQYARLYSSHSSSSTEQIFESLQENITSLYAEALNFLVRASIFFKTSSIRRHISAAIKPFATKFGPILQNVKHYESEAKSDIDVLRVDLEVQREDYANGCWLSPEDYTKTLKLLQANTAPKTCNWFLNHPKYISWRDTSSHPLTACFWVQGRLGCGKSTIAANVAKDLETTQKALVVTVFCSSGNESQSNFVAILRNCIFQILEGSRNPRASQIIVQTARHEAKTTIANQIDQLWTILDHVMSEAGYVYFVVDGLDECSGLLEEKKNFLRKFEAIVHAHEEDARLVAFSRLQAVDPIWLEGWSILEIQESDTSPDVQRFIDFSTKTSKVLQGHKLKDVIRQHLTTHAEGVILWVKLMIQGLDLNRWSVESVLAQPPRNLSELYSIICKQVTNEGPRSDTALDVLRLVCISVRPLTLEELLLALALGQGLESYEDYTQLVDLQKDGLDLVEACSPLLFLTPEQEVVLCHSSLRSFLLDGHDARPTDVDTRAKARYMFDIQELHTSMTLSLIKYMSFDDFNEDLEPFATLPAQQNEGQVSGQRLIQSWTHTTSPISSENLLLEDVNHDDLLDPLYLSYDDLPKDVWSRAANDYAKEHATDEPQQRSLAPRFLANPLLEYATKYLIEHVIASTPSIQTCGEVTNFLRATSGWFWLLRLERDLNFKNDDLDPLQFKLQTWYLASAASQNEILFSKEFVIELKERRYIQLCETSYVDTHDLSPLTMFQLMNTLIYSYRHLGRYRDLERTCTKLIESTKHELGDDFAPLYFDVGNLGVYKLEAGQLKEAEELLSESSQALERLLGIDHPETVVQKIHLADVHLTMGDYKRAEKEIEEAIHLAVNRLTEKHTTTQMALRKQADILGRVGDHTKAQEIYERILALRKELYGQQHPKTLAILDNLATTLEAQKRFGDSVKLRRQHLDELRKLLGPANRAVLTSMSRLAWVVDEMGNFKEAEELYMEGINLAIQNQGEDHPDTLALMSNLASALWSERSITYRSRLWETLKLTILVLQRRQDSLGFDAPDTLLTVRDLAVLLQHHGQYEPALEVYDFIFACRERLFGRNHEATIAIMESRAQVLDALGRVEEADKLANEILDIRVKQFGGNGIENNLDNPLFMSAMKTWYQVHFLNLLEQRAKSGQLEESKSEPPSPDAESLEPDISQDAAPELDTREEVSHAKQTSNMVLSTIVQGSQKGDVQDEISEDSEEIPVWWPEHSVWHIKAHKSLNGDSVQHCTKVEFWGFEQVSQRPSRPFRRKFRLIRDYFKGGLEDGMYHACPEPSEEGVIALKRVKIPYEKLLITLALGNDLSPFDSQMSALPEGSNARRWPAKGQFGHRIELGGDVEDVF